MRACVSACMHTCVDDAWALRSQMLLFKMRCMFFVKTCLCALSEKGTLSFSSLSANPFLWRPLIFHMPCLVTVFDFLSQRHNRLCHFTSDLMDYFLAGEDQQQTNQPNDLAGVWPLSCNLVILSPPKPAQACAGLGQMGASICCLLGTCACPGTLSQAQLHAGVRSTAPTRAGACMHKQSAMCQKIHTTQCMPRQVVGGPARRDTYAWSCFSSLPTKAMPCHSIGAHAPPNGGWSHA